MSRYLPEEMFGSLFDFDVNFDHIVCLLFVDLVVDLFFVYANDLKLNFGCKSDWMLLDMFLFYPYDNVSIPLTFNHNVCQYIVLFLLHSHSPRVTSFVNFLFHELSFFHGMVQMKTLPRYLNNLNQLPQFQHQNVHLQYLFFLTQVRDTYFCRLCHICVIGSSQCSRAIGRKTIHQT